MYQLWDTSGSHDLTSPYPEHGQPQASEVDMGGGGWKLHGFLSSVLVMILVHMWLALGLRIKAPNICWLPRMVASVPLCATQLSPTVTHKA